MRYKEPKIRRLGLRGYTLIELLAVMFVITAMGAVGKSVASRYGTGPGIGAGFLAFLASAMVVVLFYRWGWRSDRRRLQKLKEKYRAIYRVIALPTAEIKIGDYPLVSRVRSARARPHLLSSPPILRMVVRPIQSRLFPKGGARSSLSAFCGAGGAKWGEGWGEVHHFTIQSPSGEPRRGHLTIFAQVMNAALRPSSS